MANDRTSKPPGWSRRSFLTARGLGASAGGLFGAVTPEGEEPVPDDEARVGHWCISRRAMGCEFSVFLPPTISDVMTPAEAALEEIERAEDLLTVYRGNSAMAYVNQHAAKAPVRVDGRLFELLKRAAELTELTDGAFDAAAGALVRAWGFVDGTKRVPTDGERQSALDCSGMQHVEFDDRGPTVQYGKPGIEINLGSIGKGWAIDRAVRLLREDFGVDCTLLQGGRSSVYGLGSPAGDSRGWLVGIQDPCESQRRLAAVRLRDRALGTSGDANQYFEVDGRRYGHVLDPRTGWPASGLTSASVLAPDAATADALATALFVMGLDKAADFCHNHPGIAALLVLEPEPAGQATRLPRVVTFNLPPEDVDLRPGQDPPRTQTTETD